MTYEEWSKKTDSELLEIGTHKRRGHNRPSESQAALVAEKRLEHPQGDLGDRRLQSSPGPDYDPPLRQPRVAP